MLSLRLPAHLLVGRGPISSVWSIKEVSEGEGVRSRLGGVQRLSYR
jgi:hypothetical protein